MIFFSIRFISVANYDFARYQIVANYDFVRDQT